MSDASEPAKASNRIKDRPLARPPWQLVMVGLGESNDVSVSSDTTNALTRLLDHLPSLTGLTLRTGKGDLVVSRDFPPKEMDIVDGLIASVFTNDPHITGIVFPATGSRTKHVATADKPHFLPPKKADL